MKETAALSNNGRSEGGRMCWEVGIGGEGWGYWRDDIPAGLHGRSGALECFVAVYSSNVTLLRHRTLLNALLIVSDAMAE
jgi:hypothetical protein